MNRIYSILVALLFSLLSLQSYAADGAKEQTFVDQYFGLSTKTVAHHFIVLQKEDPLTRLGSVQVWVGRTTAYLSDVYRFRTRSTLGTMGDAPLDGREFDTPLQFLGSESGDCKSAATLKYFALDGIPGKLRLAYVKALTSDSNVQMGHLVVLYWPLQQDDPYVLDNLEQKIRRLSDRVDLTVVYTFDRMHLYRGATDVEWMEASEYPEWWRLLHRIDIEMGKK